jgi:hypothetical protein
VGIVSYTDEELAELGYTREKCELLIEGLRRDKARELTDRVAGLRARDQPSSNAGVGMRGRARKVC